MRTLAAVLTKTHGNAKRMTVFVLRPGFSERQGRLWGVDAGFGIIWL
jgi:hypothetical protein